MNKVIVYKGKLSDILKEMKEDIKNGKKLVNIERH